MENITVEQIYNLLNARLLDKRTGESIAFLGWDIRLMKNDGEKA